MEILTLFDSLSNYVDINIKICNHVTHSHNWHETQCKVDYDLWVVLEGAIKVTVDKCEYTAYPYDVIFLYPETLYHAESPEGYCKFIYIHFDFKIGNNMRGLNDFQLAGHISKKNIHTEVKNLINTYWMYKKKDTLSFLMLKGHFLVLLSKIIKHQYHQVSSPLIDFKDSKNILRLQPALAYIEKNLDRSLYIYELASLCQLSEKYFITVFNNALGVTPKQYISQLKMNKALEYLYEHKYTVKEIAFLLGYPDPYAFSKAFKKYYHFAPSKYLCSKQK